MKKKLKYINGISKVLNILAREVKEKGYFDNQDQELLKKMGSSLLFMGVTLDYKK